MRYILYFLVLLFLLASCTNKQSKHCNLLKHYAQELEYLELLACTEGEGQLIRSATYKVPGKQALALEEYLVKEYGMGKLVFGCCGWEMEGGKEGEIQQKEIQALNENYHLLLSLTGNAEKKDEIKGSYIEKERENIDFILTVRLVEI